jgi:dTDP-4-dehydrorhamnose reductase
VKLLILGANSLLGRALVQLLHSQSVEFHALGAQELDLLRKMDVIKAINAVRPDLVLNVATYSNLEKAEFDADAARECDIVNTQGVSILAEVCRHLEIPLLHHSSSFVFDGQKVHPYGEDDLTNPVSRYGMSKWYGERAIRDVLPRHIILRTDWLFSREKPDFFQRHIELCKRQRGRLEVVNHRFSPTPAADAARVLLAIARQVDCAAELWGTYHYCALQPMSQDHFVEGFLQEAAKYDPELAGVIPALEITRLPVQLPYVPNTVLNTQRLFETFGIKQRSRAGEINALLQGIYRLDSIPAEPEAVTPDKGDIADRAEDTEGVVKRVRKPRAAAKPAKKAAARKSSRTP